MNRKIFVISVLIFVIDQVVKSLISAMMTLGESIKIINNFFNLTYYHNYGAAWSFFKGNTTLIILGTVMALVLIYRYMYSFRMNKRNIIAFGLLSGGIIGNLVDRLFMGYVVDYLDFILFNYNFPIFNIADISIVIGVMLLIVAIFKGEDKFGKDSSKK